MVHKNGAQKVILTAYRLPTGACNMTADFRGLVVFRVTDMTYTTPTVCDICTFACFGF